MVHSAYQCKLLTNALHSPQCVVLTIAHVAGDVGHLVHPGSFARGGRFGQITGFGGVAGTCLEALDSPAVSKDGVTVVFIFIVVMVSFIQK